MKILRIINRNIVKKGKEHRVAFNVLYICSLLALNSIWTYIAHISMVKQLDSSIFLLTTLVIFWLLGCLTDVHALFFEVNLHKEYKETEESASLDDIIEFVKQILIMIFAIGIFVAALIFKSKFL